jgi:uncharacterized protein with HEPN domain
LRRNGAHCFGCHDRDIARGGEVPLDGLRAAERIARFTAGLDFDGYLEDEMLRAAVERQFEIISEAFTGLRRIDLGLADGIPDLPRIVAFRNVLIHGYATVDDQLLWGVVERDLPTPLSVLTHMLAEAER